MRNPTIPPGVTVENLSGSDLRQVPAGVDNLLTTGMRRDQLAEMILKVKY
ncbi:hypothetical protein ACNEP6_00010 [Escherichia coli]